MIEQETVTGSNKAALPSGDIWNSCSGFTKEAVRQVGQKHAFLRTEGGRDLRIGGKT